MFYDIKIEEFLIGIDVMESYRNIQLFKHDKKKFEQDFSCINVLEIQNDEFSMLEIIIDAYSDVKIDFQLHTSLITLLFKKDLDRNSDLKPSFLNLNLCRDGYQNIIPSKFKRCFTFISLFPATHFNFDGLFNSTIQISIASKIIDQIKKIKHPTHIQLYLIKSKFYELLSLLYSSNQNNEDEASKLSEFKEDDIAKLNIARSIIEKDIKNPCSLIELAHEVGLNDFKLKKGFKELFGNTVFGYLHELRMQLSFDLLRQNHKVNEVAYMVGYKNAHHFTAAFKKKYGLLPKDFKRLY